MVRGRGQLTPKEIELRRIISNNINSLLSNSGKKQIDIHRATGIPKSTLTGYVKGTSIPTAGNVQKLASFFSVGKSVIDPRFSTGMETRSASKSSDIISIEEKNSIPTIIERTVEVMNELEPPRQEKVYSFAEHELKEQKSYHDKKISDLASYKKRKQESQQQDTIDYYGSVSAGTGEFLLEEYKEAISLPSSMIPLDADFCLTVNGNSMEPIILDGSYVFIDETNEIPSGTISAVIVNGEAYVKRVWFENSHARLESFNDKYEDIIVTEEDDFHIIGKVVM